MSWLHAVNFFALQWLGLRLCRVRRFTQLRSDDDRTRLRVPIEDGWSVMIGVLPLTGWWSRYRRLTMRALWWGGQAGLRFGI